MSTGKWLAGILSLYALACISPAIGPNGMIGIYCLIFLPIVVYIPAWWANPLFFAGCIALSLGCGRLAWQLGLVALLLALSILYRSPMQGLSIGALFWMASIIGLTIAGFNGRREGDKPAKPDELDEI